MTSGFGAKALAIDTLCCWPPEISCGYLFLYGCKLVMLIISSNLPFLISSFDRPNAIFFSTVK